MTMLVACMVSSLWLKRVTGQVTKLEVLASSECSVTSLLLPVRPACLLAGFRPASG